MAGYLSPAAYLYVEEQEYLQAYEDVLERYKGMWSLAFGAAGLGTDQRGNCYLCLTRATPKDLVHSKTGPDTCLLVPQAVVGNDPETPLDGW